MGWLFSQPSKEALIQSLLDPRQYEGKILDSSVRGNRLWVLYEESDGRRIIGLFLMEVRSGVWGYKSMDETMHPYYYDCPLRLLENATEPLNDSAREWRENVRKHHAHKAAQKAAQKAANPKPQEGMIVTFDGVDFRLINLVGRDGWQAERVQDGILYLITSAQVCGALKKAAMTQEAA